MVHKQRGFKQRFYILTDIAINNTNYSPNKGNRWAIHPQAERRQPCKSLSSPPKSQEVGNRRRSCEWITLNFRIRRKSIFPAFINNIHNQIFPFSPPPPNPLLCFFLFSLFRAIFWVLSLLAGAFCYFPTALFASRYLFSLLSRHDGIMIGSCLLVKGIFFPFPRKERYLGKGDLFLFESLDWENAYKVNEWMEKFGFLWFLCVCVWKMHCVGCLLQWIWLMVLFYLSVMRFLIPIKTAVR